MGSNPINLAIRFLLELSALLALGVWGWQQSAGWPRLLLALLIPLTTALAWGTFAVPDDPSRSGSAPVAIPGILRLALELAVFILASWALYDVDLKGLSLVFAVIVAIHYIVSYDRILWLVKQ